MNDQEDLQKEEDPDYVAAQKRVRKIKYFYKELSGWASVSIILLGMDFFLSGGITWSKYPVFFYGLFILAEAVKIIRLQRLDKAWEARQLQKFTGRRIQPQEEDALPGEDYSETLLRENEKEPANLSDYRKLNKPWKEDDLV